MGIKKIKKFRDLPFVLNRVYTTKMQTKDQFLLKEIMSNGHMVKGIYVGCEHLGICALGIDRLIPETEFECEIDVCDKCGESIN